jgi:hypothetical protein
MKKILASLFVGSVLTLTACQQKPKTEENSIDSTATTVMPSDTTSITADSLDTGAGLSSEGISTTATPDSSREQ